MDFALRVLCLLGWFGYLAAWWGLLERRRARRLQARARARLDRLEAALREVLPLLAALPVEVTGDEGGAQPEERRHHDG